MLKMMLKTSGQQLASLLLLILSLLPFTASARDCACAGNMVVLGVYEQVRLDNLKKLKVEALLDSGATTTALDARNIRMYVNRKGRRWVYYDFRHKESGTKVSMHQPVSRVARVITHSGKPTERAVVKNTISIGNITRFIEMSLINRSNFPQQLLVGRNFLKRTVLVDSGARDLQKGSR